MEEDFKKDPEEFEPTLNPYLNQRSRDLATKRGRSCRTPDVLAGGRVMNRTQSTMNNENLRTTKGEIKRDQHGHMILPLDKNFKIYLDQ